MNTDPGILLVGFSHRTASVDVRERYAIAPTDLGACLRSLHEIDGVREAVALSTCNRTEILVVCESPEQTRADIVSKIFRNIDSDQLYTFRGLQAVMHEFRVAAGLDSLVLGESEVLAQVKRSIDAAREAGTIGRELDAVMREALASGKRVRRETRIGSGTLSVARAGVEVASRVFGSFEKRRALVIGAGETGVLVARHLHGLRVGRLTFCNRTLERARDAALEFGAQAVGLDTLRDELSVADIVISCVDGGGAIVELEHFDEKALRQRDRPFLVVDLSVPRAVAAGARELPNVLLYNLDDLERVVARNLEGREEALSEATTLLVAGLHKYLALRTFSSFSPAIEELRRRFATLRDEALDTICGPKAEGTHVQLAHELERRLLDAALNQIKQGARSTSSESELDAAYKRFLENL